MKKRLFKAAAAGMAFVMCLSMAGCGSGTTPTATMDAASAEGTEGSAAGNTADNTGSSDDAFEIELTTAPVGLHPLKTNDAPSQYVAEQIYETLYLRSEDGTSYEPLLAEELPEFSEDGLTAVIHLRKNVTFQDGTPFTSADVAYMIDSLKDTSYGSQRPSIVESIESYECPDDNTIILHLAYNDGVLTAKLAHSNGAIVNSKLEKSGQDFLVDPTGAGTGPYKFVSATAGSEYTLEANEDYWGGAPAIKKVHYSIVTDESTAIARLQTGEADFCPNMSSDSFSTISSIAGYTAGNAETSTVYYLQARSDETALNDLMANPDFRKAIFESFDYQTYCDTMLNGLASYSASLVGSTLVGYTEAMEDAGVSYDPEDAKAIIEENGWTGEKVTILAATRDWQQNVAVYLQSQLQDIGLEADIISEEWATFLDDAKTDDYFDITILSWSNVTGDGQQMLEPNFSTKNGTRAKYNNADFDALVEASAKTTDLSERQQYMLEAVQMIQGDYVAEPLYNPDQIYCYNSTDYGNVNIAKDGLFYIKNFTLN